ncbi:MAG: UDP-N-acetyl-D-mannosamine dehydrogenase [Micrococcales bacterium]|nr:UDP-N-acetyl-D-mannosamine dehydrogenase [Micrococcales bacterium]
MASPTVVVVGLGYIGLPTAAVLASRGADVVGVDVNLDTVAAVNAGRVPFVEPDLERTVSAAVASGSLRARTAPPPADVYIIAVPTPFTAGHRPDLSYVEAACDAIAGPLTGGELVVLESTSPPGTTQLVADRIMIARPDLSVDGSDGRPRVHFAHAPERVLPGRIMHELVANDRIVGGLTPVAAERARDLYASFCAGTILTTDALTAEMSKLVENSYRDVNIAFANELSLICDQMGIDVWELIDLANHHPRVDILRPGPGVGGHCVAVDPWFVVAADPVNTRLVRTAREVNDAKPHHVVQQVVAAARRWRSPRITCLGLTFKAGVDDMRQSPAVQVVREVVAQVPEAVVEVVEPHITRLPAELVGKVSLGNLWSSVEWADVVVLLVDHAEFGPVGKRLRATPGKIVIDTRGAWR